MSAEQPPRKEQGPGSKALKLAAPQPLLPRLFRAFATPQFLSALLVLVATILFLVYGPRGVRPERQIIDLGAATNEAVQRQVRLVMFDLSGIERSENVSLTLLPGAGAQLTGVLAALREALIGSGVWPEQLLAPRVFLETIERRTVAVIDLLVPEPVPENDSGNAPAVVAVSVAQEQALLRSLTATALANGAAEVRFLRNGRPQETLLEHVAVPSSL